MEMRYCPHCGGEIQYKIPRGDQRQRAMCQTCDAVHYQNPNVVVGVVAFWQDQFLLCKRAIEPRKNFWTIPAGYLELNESTEEGALREAWEESFAQLKILDLLAVYNLSHISQVQILYLAELTSREVAAGEESLEVGLFAWSEIPWDDLAFPSVYWALHHARAMMQQSVRTPELRSSQLEIGQELPRL